MHSPSYVETSTSHMCFVFYPGWFYSEGIASLPPLSLHLAPPLAPFIPQIVARSLGKAWWVSECTVIVCLVCIFFLSLSSLRFLESSLFFSSLLFIFTLYISHSLRLHFFLFNSSLLFSSSQLHPFFTLRFSIVILYSVFFPFILLFTTDFLLYTLLNFISALPVAIATIFYNFMRQKKNVVFVVIFLCDLVGEMLETLYSTQ